MKNSKKTVALNLLRLLFIAFVASVAYGPMYIMWSYYTPLQDAYSLSHEQIAWLSSIAGLIAMPGYLFGGFLADRFKLRNLTLITMGLMAVASFIYATLPAWGIVIAVQAFMALLMGMVFWSCMIKVTRVLAAQDQGGFFGFLEGARKLSTAVIHTVCITVFALSGEGTIGLQGVLTAYGVMCVIGFVMAFFLLRNIDEDAKKLAGTDENSKVHLADVGTVLRIPAVWMVALTLFLVYTVSTSQQYVTSYLTSVYEVSQTMSAIIYSVTQYIGPVFIIVAGFLGDRTGIIRSMVVWSFVFIGGLVVLALLPVSTAMAGAAMVMVVFYLSAVYAVRGMYWALLDLSAIPMSLSGTAIGIISVIAYSPDFIVPQIISRMLDANPGATGYHMAFVFQIVAGLLGIVVMLVLAKYLKKQGLIASLKGDKPAELTV